MTVLRRFSGLLLFASVVLVYFSAAWLSLDDPQQEVETAPNVKETPSTFRDSAPLSTKVDSPDGTWDALPTEHAVGVHAWHLSTTTTTVPVPPVRVTAPAAPAPPVPPPVRGGGDPFDALAQCESGGNPQAVSPSGRYFGAFQFLPSTWRSIGYPGLPTDHSYAVQKEAAQVLQARAGWGQWPGCSRQLGLR